MNKKHRPRKEISPLIFLLSVVICALIYAHSVSGRADQSRVVTRDDPRSPQIDCVSEGRGQRVIVNGIVRGCTKDPTRLYGPE